MSINYNMFHLFKFGHVTLMGRKFLLGITG